jgi:hypothetical protein
LLCTHTFFFYLKQCGYFFIFVIPSCFPLSSFSLLTASDKQSGEGEGDSERAVQRTATDVHGGKRTNSDQQTKTQNVTLNHSKQLTTRHHRNTHRIFLIMFARLFHIFVFLFSPLTWSPRILSPSVGFSPVVNLLPIFLFLSLSL